MLTLKEIFDDLAYGEFSGMAVGNAKTQEGITPDKYKKITNLVNAALLDLFTRFVFRKKELDLHQKDGVTRYYLRASHVGDPLTGGDDIYLDGTKEDELNNDIIKILEAYDEDGNRVFINDHQYPDDIFMPEMDVIKLRDNGKRRIISLVYQASYPRIGVTSDFDPAAVRLDVPSTIKTAIMMHAASRLFTGKTSNVGEGQRSMSSTFLYRYETECSRIRDLVLMPMEDTEVNAFNNRGFV